MPAERARILLVGDLATDVLASIAPPADAGTGLAVGTDTWAKIVLSGGGSAANTAVWLARAGTPVTFIGAVGADEAGRSRVAELSAAGVDCAVARLHGVATGTMVIITDATERTILSDRGANGLLPADHVTAAIRDADDATHLHLSAYPLFDPGSRPAARAALAAARAAGLTISVDAASAAPLARAGRAAFADWVGPLDLLIANLDEARVLAGDPTASPADAARELTALAAGAVVKLGPGGAVLATADTLHSVPARRVGAVDPTGAGDAFAAGLLAARALGSDPPACLRAGSVLGARAVTTLGAR